MKIRRWAAAACWALSAACAPAACAAPAGDEARTRDYFQRLVATPARTAELELLLERMPKGGDLHHHYTGAQYAETYLDWVGAQDWCIWRDTLRIETRHPTPAAGDQAPCLSADDVKRSEDTYRALLRRWSDKDYGHAARDAPPPDQQFFDTFGFFSATSGYRPDEGLRLLRQRAKAENVQYIETMLRGAPPLPARPEGAALDALPPGAPVPDVQPLLQRMFDGFEADPAVRQALRDYRRELDEAAAGLDDESFTLRMQSYVSRNNPPSQVFAGLYGAFRTAQDDPLVVGVNIVGPENGVVAMRDYALHMHMLAFLKARFPATHLALHAGELAVGMVPPEGLRDHVRLAVDEAGADRIGHGVDIAHETGAWELLGRMRQRGVAVEINLSSNAFILGVEGFAHPVSLYRRAGVPIVLSTDDAGVSRSTLAREYLLFVTQWHPTYAQMRAIVRDSLRLSFLPPAQRDAQLRELDRRFARFEAETARSAAALSP